jgi:extracellular factor (EF) 3-hydroxypalmitic acid methyl ester biosynthesis protein
MSVPLDDGMRAASLTSEDSTADPSVSDSISRPDPQPSRRKTKGSSTRNVLVPVREARPPIHREVWSSLLDTAYAKLQSSPAVEALEDVFIGLNEMRCAAGPDWWVQFSEIDSLTHAIKNIFHQDPFTLRSFEKPRGYAGDAVMLDYIYGQRPAPPGTSEVGRRIFDFTTNAPASQSVRNRRDLLAQYIDQAAQEHLDPRILAIACGHLREADQSRAMQDRRLHHFHAFDQDTDSLAVVEETYPDRGIKTIQGSVKGILSGKAVFKEMDLVYAAGLYDYLTERVAIRLTRQMFEMLAPGGRLLIANFAPTLRDIGYMETYMGWKLIYRTLEQMNNLLEDIQPEAISGTRVFEDSFGNIVYLEIVRK